MRFIRLSPVSYGRKRLASSAYADSNLAGRKIFYYRARLVPGAKFMFGLCIPSPQPFPKSLSQGKASVCCAVCDSDDPLEDFIGCTLTYTHTW
eukprot:2391699-Amphidinium_carterae.1